MDRLAALIQDLGHPDRERRAACVEGLMSRGEVAVLPLCEVLRTGEPLQRCGAADVLAELGDGRAVAPLIGLLGYPHGGVRTHAAKALGRLGAEGALLPLSQVLRAGPPETAVEAAEAIGALGMRGAPGAVLALTDTLDAGSPEAAAAALDILTRWARTAPSAPLREAIPVLWRKLGLFNRPTPDLQRACWSTLQAIDAATAHLKDLPRPAGAGPSARNLPVPAEATETDSASLPIAAADPSEEP